MTLILALLATLASAAEIQVALATPVMVVVDGQVLTPDQSMRATARDLGTGGHEVVIRNMVGKQVASVYVEVGEGEQVRLRYARKVIHEIGRGPMPVPPPPELAPEPPEPAQAGTAAGWEPTTEDETALAVAAVPGATATAESTHRTTGGEEHVTQTATVNGQEVARTEMRGSEDGVSIQMTVTDPVTGEVIEAGVTAGSTGITMTVDGLDGDVPASPAPPARGQRTRAPAPAPVPVGPQAMASGDFEALRRALGNESFSSDQLDLIRTAARHNHFTCEQVGGLVDAFAHSSDKVEAVEVLRPRVVDPGNAFRLDAHFTFSSDKKAVQALFQ